MKEALKWAIPIAVGWGLAWLYENTDMKNLAIGLGAGAALSLVNYIYNDESDRLQAANATTDYDPHLNAERYYRSIREWVYGIASLLVAALFLALYHFKGV